MRVFCIPSGVAPSFSEGDVLIAISSSGTTKTTKTQVEQAKEKGVIIISVVSEKYSEITELSNIFIVLPQKPSNKEEEIVHLFPLNTFFEILALMFLDSLIPYLMKQLGVTEPEMAKNHPHY
jgi:6-phospho-3-hexuloisomerase